MGLFNKDRKDAKYINPEGSIAAIFPFIFDKRTESEVSSTIDIDVEELCKYVDEKNKEGNLEYKMTYFHAIMASFGIVFFNRNKLNRFIRNKRLYERNKITFAFIAKDKMSDDADEKIICMDLDPNDTGLDLSKKMAIDVFKSKKEGKNDFDDILKKFTNLPHFLLSIIVNFVKFLDKHGKNPKALTEGDTNYATVIFSNLGSIKSNSCYHHLNEYGTNSIVITIGTIKKKGTKRVVDMTFTLDERIADGFYFARSIQLADYIASNPKLLLEDFEKKVEIEK